MKNINVYDIEAEKLDKICEEHDTSEAEIIEALFDIIDDLKIDLSEYL